MKISKIIPLINARYWMIIVVLAAFLVTPYATAAPGFNYDESKSLVDNVLDNCPSSPGWLTSLKSLVQMSPSKEKCDEGMVALYKFCYTSVGIIEGLAEGFGRTIQPGSLGGNIKEKCSDERLLNYEYPEWFQSMINERNLNEKLINK